MKVVDNRPSHSSIRDLFFDADPIRGKRVERMELDTIGIACRGRIVGHARLYTEGGGLVHAVLVEPEMGLGSELRAVYLDREAGHFVQCEVPQ